MRKNFLILMLMTLLPLAGWAQTTIDNEYDVNVVPSDASAVWCGGKPTVQAGWLIVQSETATKPTKADVAAQIEVVDLADYNVGNHTYVLKLKTGALGYVDIATGVEDHYNRYYLHTNAQNTATLTITKYTGAPEFTTTALAFVGGDLVYTGEPQALLSGGATATANGFTVPVVYTTKETPAETDWVALADLKETNANTTGYTVKYKVVGTDNYAGSEVKTMVGTKAIAKATQNFAAEGAAPTANTWIYDAQAHALAIAPTAPVQYGTYEYCATNSTDDEDWTTDPTTITGTSNTGNKTVWWRVKDTENYKGNAAASLTATINKATPVLNVDGVINTAWNLYDGENHNLFLKRATATIGETTLGTDAISYNARYKAPGGSYGSWFGDKTNPTNSNFTNKKDAGSYQVQIWVKETADYNAVYHKPNNQFVRIDVAKADITSYTEPVAKTGLRANGTHALVEAATWGANTPAGTFAYSLNGTDWVADVPTASVAGDYTVYFKMTPTDATNYNVFTKSYAVSIAAANPAYIIPVAKSKSYGQSTDPELTWTVSDGTTTLDNSVLKGTVTLAREAGNAVGKYIIYVQNYEPGENEDYDVLNVLNTPGSTDAANKTAFFSIIADPNNTLKLKFADAAVATKVYDGTTAIDFDNDDLEIESGALGTDTWETLKASANITFALKTTEGAAPANANVGNYQVVATYSDGLVNYANVEIAPLAYTITKKQLAVVVEDQTIDYGAAIASAETTNWNLAVGSAYAAGEDNDDAGIVLYTAQAINKYEPGSENADAIMAKIEGDSNYEIAAEGNTWGKLTINAGAALVLNSDADDLDKINAFNGKNVNVSIDFTARNTRELPAGTARTWTADTWVTLTLPFNISVADLSQKLGYAIVNVIDPSRTEVSGTSSKFYGKLTMKGGNGDGTEDYLVANKPFLVKTADAITGVINFGTQTIVAPASADDLSVDAGGGAKFTGTYATKNVTSADNAAIWFMIGGNRQSWAYITTTSSAAWDILPFEGYIDMSGVPAGARNMTFIFEELDGSTTAIKSVNVDDLNSKIAAEGMYNMNGMKLNTVPTQKGVYILNGKKVVIK